MKIGVLLLNMGGPDSLESVRPFLYNLFSDRNIIQLGPSLLQRPIAWFIAKKRAPKSMACYEKIGGCSPLLEITNRQALALEEYLNITIGPKEGITFYCRPAMRYFAPRTPDQLKTLKEEKAVDGFVALSMYPHYSRATSGTSVEDFVGSAQAQQIANYKVISSYPDHPMYIEALAKCLERGLEKIKDREGFKLIYSAHSLPVSLVEQGDPYVEHIRRTISALERRTGLRGALCFQSRSGPVKWLEPATDTMLMELASQGVREILCLPISFVSDHIETLYEIDLLYGNMLAQRGVRLVRTPALNDSPLFISALADLVSKAVVGL